MRIRRSVSDTFRALVFPAIACAVTGYFGAYAVFGTRGAHALEDTDAALGVQQERLETLKDQARLLQHRIELMNRPDPDSDLVEELARGELLDGAPGQIAIRRDAEDSRQ